MKNCMYIILLYSLLCSCSVKNVRILDYNFDKSRALTLTNSETSVIKKQNDFLLYKDRMSSKFDTLGYESVWGYVTSRDTIRLFPNNKEWKFEFGNIRCISLYSRKAFRYPSFVTKNYFFTINSTMEPVPDENANVIKYLFDGDGNKFKEFKKQHNLRGEYNVKVLRKVIELQNCQFK